MRLLFVCAFVMSVAPGALSADVYVEHDSTVPRAAYAAGALDEALEEKGYRVSDQKADDLFVVKLAVDADGLEAEAFSIHPDGGTITVHGGDERGMIYGALALAADLRKGTRLEQIEPATESPHLPFRGIKHNLAWDSYRSSSALRQHKETLRDVDYWEAFLDMMAENRFNTLTLWNLHPFPYMIMPENFPEASPFTEEELAEWRALYRNIFRMADERGIETYLVNWNIFVSRALAEAHNLEGQNYYPNYFEDGDTSEVVKTYTRECVTQVLEEYPNLDGFGVSYGEGMGGMTPQERQDWMNETIIEGIRQADRTAKFINRAPFSAGTGSGGSTSEATENLSRAAMEEWGDLFEGPVWVEMKFNWSHAHSTPKLVKVHGGDLGDAYFKPEPENYKITWMARNEDFFALRWGAPDFIREHIALNGQESYVGGYFVGSETYIPAKDYFTAIEEPVDWTYAFERQWLFYMLWGRLLYDPDTPDDVFEAEFVRRYGEQAGDLLEAYSLASSVPLRLASAFNSTWDFTLYSEGFLSLHQGEVRYISVDRLIQQAPLDPDYVSVADYVDADRRDRSFEEHRVTPPKLADMLEQECREALRLVEGLSVENDASLMYEVADVRAWAKLGLHFAEKLRGAVALQTFRQTGEDAHKEEAIARLEQALDYWDEVIEITRPLYRDMPLTHYGHEEYEDNLFHWESVRPEVAADVEIAENAEVQ
ncbi:MAG: glycoside hydrolase family 20 zincin-like fold domain-containing protein [Candidatus Hydrogenedentota bacterium]